MIRLKLLSIVGLFVSLHAFAAQDWGSIFVQNGKETLKLGVFKTAYPEPAGHGMLHVVTADGQFFRIQMRTFAEASRMASKLKNSKVNYYLPHDSDSVIDLKQIFDRDYSASEVEIQIGQSRKRESIEHFALKELSLLQNANPTIGDRMTTSLQRLLSAQPHPSSERIAAQTDLSAKNIRRPMGESGFPESLSESSRSAVSSSLN